MKEAYLQYLCCTSCGESLRIDSVESRKEDRIETGKLKCDKCQAVYSITKFIPRFVSNDNYATGFGFQWNIHAKTQLDSYTGLEISQKRFFKQTQWPRDLTGETILEVGCGSGRFTEPAASTNAIVISLDYSVAVEANYLNNGQRENVFIVQGDVYRMPFRKNFFDKVFCFGVLQHTPDPAKAFIALASFPKPGGDIAIDVYRNYWKTWLISKYYLRPFTRRIKPDRLYRMIKGYVDFMWPLSEQFRKIPMWGPKINLMMGIPDHSELGLQGKVLKEWAYLDAFDMFSPRYDFSQKKETVEHWLKSQSLNDIEVDCGDLGLVVARGKSKGKV